MVKDGVTIIRPNGLIERLERAGRQVAPLTYAAPARQLARREADGDPPERRRRTRRGREPWRGRLVDLLC